MPLFVRGLIPLWEEARRELSFRVYVTDALRWIAENTARIGGGRLPRDRWADGAGFFRGGTSEESAEETVMRIAREAGIAILDTDPAEG